MLYNPPKLPRQFRLRHWCLITMAIFILLCFAAVLRLAEALPILPISQFGVSDNFSYASLENLAHSRENRKLFSQLLFSDNAFWLEDSSTVGTLDYVSWNQYQRQPYVANGYLGSRIPNLGHGFAYDTLSSDSAPKDDLSNGWPLFNKRYAGAFVAGFYDLQHNTTKTNFPWLLQEGYESVIAAVPQWTTLQVEAQVNGSWHVLNPAISENRGTISEYSQSLCFSTGIVTTSYVWLDKLRVLYSVLAHRQDVNLGIVDLHISSLDEEIPVKVLDILDFLTAQRCRFNATGQDADGIHILYSPKDIDYVYGATYSKLVHDGKSEFHKDSKNVSQVVSFTATPQGSRISKLVGVVTSDLDPKKYNSFDDVLQKAKSVAAKASVDSSIKSHIDSWSKTIEKPLKITFPDNRLLTLAARSSVYHLNANTRPDASGVSAAVGVGGLSSDSYGGMVFWDTDLWMLRGLLPYSPSHARSIVNYRIHTHEQAQKNLQSDYAPQKNMHGAAFPWTSGRFGNCTATGPCFDYEYHINTAIALGAMELYKSGAVDDDFLEQSAYPLINDAATFLSEYVQYNESLQKYTTHNLTDPDEYANHVDNAAYTNSAISATLKFAAAVLKHLKKPVPKEYGQIENNMYLPVSPDDKDIVLEYDSMNSSIGIKQADVVMITYPLENNLISEKLAKVNMEYSSLKQVDFGPAMTYPIFSIVSSALLDKGCTSESYLTQSVQPFLRGPFAQFSEQNNDDFATNGGTNPAFPFMTAHGGFLQAILQGLVGLRFDYNVTSGRINRFLTLDPIKLKTLPNGASFDGIQYQQQLLSFNLTSSKLSVTHQGPAEGSPKPFEIKLGSRNPSAGFYTIKPYETLVFPIYEAPDAFSGLSECGKASLTNVTESVYGDSTVLANDGDNTTFWQAMNAEDAKILIDLKNAKTFSNLTINWGDRPPKQFSVSASKDDYLKQYSFKDYFDVLQKIDFGNSTEKFHSGKTIQQEDAFRQIFHDSVSITEPYQPEDQHLIVLPSKHNITSVDLPETSARFVLLEFSGVHDNGKGEGAKIYELNVS